jgi:uncharacterized protein (DUF58 family)
MNDLGLLAAARPTPARPGPGSIPEALVAALELPIGRRSRGVMPGDHPAIGAGVGLELDRIRAYVPGDDVRSIDWNVTARTGEPHVREHVPERQLTTWLLIDGSASMHFGTADRRKADVAAGVALVVGRLAARRSNRLGVVSFGGPRQRFLAPVAGRRAMLGLVGILRDDAAEEGGGHTSPAAAMRLAARSRTAASMAVVVSDFRGPRDWRSALAELTARHSVVAVEVVDPREDELVDVGDVTFVDPESGRTFRADTGDRRLRALFGSAAADDRAAVKAIFRELGVQHVVLSTAGPWLPGLVRGFGGKARSI